MTPAIDIPPPKDREEERCIPFLFPFRAGGPFFLIAVPGRSFFLFVEGDQTGSFFPLPFQR